MEIPAKLLEIPINREVAIKNWARWQVLQRKGHRRKVKIDYFDLFELLVDPVTTEVELGKKFGVSRQAINELYRTYFEDCLPKNFLRGTPEDSREAGRVAARAAREKGWTEESLVQAISKEALRHALPVSVRSASGEISRRTLWIAGKQCRLFSCQKMESKPPGSQYEYVRLDPTYKTLEQVDFLFIDVEVPGYPSHLYILPTELLLRRFRKTKALTIALHIPLRERRRRLKIDWNDYEGERGWKRLKALIQSALPASVAIPAEAA